MSDTMHYNPGNRRSIHMDAMSDFAGSGFEGQKIQNYSGPQTVDPGALLERAVDPKNSKNAIPAQRLMARHELQEPATMEELHAVKSFAQMIGTELNAVDHHTVERSMSKPRANQLSAESLFGHLRHQQRIPTHDRTPQVQVQQPQIQPPPQQVVQHQVSDTLPPGMPSLPPATIPVQSDEIIQLEKKISKLESLIEFDMETTVDFVSESTESSGISNFRALISLLKISLQNNDKVIKISINED
jgi:hypothetical protein